MKICVYTCITGSYDNLPEIKIKEKDVDYICFTNNKNIKSKDFKIIYIDDKIDNHILGRKIKMLGHEYLEKNYDICVWMDASVTFDKSVKEFVKKYLKDNPIAFFKHYCRNNVYDEAVACIRFRKDSKEKILKILDFLKKEKYDDNGLYETTVYIKKINDEKVKETMKLWYYMIENYTIRDQLSINYCTKKTGINVSIIDGIVWDNPYFHTVSHNYKKDLKKCRIYYGNHELVGHNNNDFNIDLNEEIDYIIKDNIYSVKTKVLGDTSIIKVQITDVPLLKYSDLLIKSNYKNIDFVNLISYNNSDIFYNDFGVLNVYGNFKKGDSFEFSIRLEKLSEKETIELVNYSCYNTIHLVEDIHKISRDNELLRNDMLSVLNSKSWKITKPLRFITEKLKK